MGRPAKSADDLRFRTEIAQKFRKAMKDHDLKTWAAAARALGVTRQAFSQYMREKTTPQPEVLARACTTWKLGSLTYRSTELKAGAFALREAKTELDALQLDLFNEPLVFANPHLVITVERAQKTALQVTIKMKKAGLRRRSSRIAKRAS